MLPQQYCLRWKYHHSNLQTMFSQLLDRGCFCDVTLACEGQLIRAHRVVLCACSTFFDTVLTNYATERDPIVIMKDANFSDVKCLIEFMYKGEINVEYSNLASLLKTAEDLKIKGLAEVSWREEEFDSTIPMAEATLRIQDDFDANHMKRMTETTPTEAEPHILHKLPTLTPMPSLHHEMLGTRRKRGRPPLDESYDVFSSPKAAAIEKISISTQLISHKEKTNTYRLPQPPPLPLNLQPQQQPSPQQAQHQQQQQQQQQQQHQKQKEQEKHQQLEENHHQQHRQHIPHQLQHRCNHHPVANEDEEMINPKTSQHLSEYQNRSDGETWPPSVDRHAQVDSDSDHDEKPEVQSELILDENHYGDGTEEQETNNETRELIDSHQQMERDAEEHDDNLSSDHKMEELDIGDYKLTDEELDKWKDVIKMDAYLATGRRPQFWEEPFTRRILEAIREKKLEMKKAARLLGVSYGTLYGRYREVYGCLKHPFRGTSAMMSRYEHWPSKTINVLETKTALPKDTDELWLR